jgi:hypothetical protein
MLSQKRPPENRVPEWVKRVSCLGVSASPPTPDVSLQGNEPTLRANRRLNALSSFFNIDDGENRPLDASQA